MYPHLQQFNQCSWKKNDMKESRLLICQLKKMLGDSSKWRYDCGGTAFGLIFAHIIRDYIVITTAVMMVFSAATKKH